MTNATLPDVLRLAERGVILAAAADPGLAAGVNVAAGQLTYQAVAEAAGREFVPLAEALGPRSTP